jgi:hypothetical protein
MIITPQVAPHAFECIPILTILQLKSLVIIPAKTCIYFIAKGYLNVEYQFRRVNKIYRLFYKSYYRLQFSLTQTESHNDKSY